VRAAAARMPSAMIMERDAPERTVSAMGI
jgi:hypothetical protein